MSLLKLILRRMELIDSLQKVMNLSTDADFIYEIIEQQKKLRNEIDFMKELQRELNTETSIGPSKDQFISGHSYFAKHRPTGEEWYILGISTKYDRVCAAGYPPSMARLSDCIDFEINKPLTEDEIKHRDKHFGQNWL